MKLDEIEKLCIEATLGPWSSSLCYGLNNKLTGHSVVGEICDPGNYIYTNDANFIAASRELMPKLLKVAKAAKVINDTMIREHQYIYGAEILDKALEELEKD